MSAANPETPNSTISREASTQSSSAAASQGWVLPEGKIVPNTVFVGGIDARMDETEIGSCFGRYGSVKEVKIITNRTGVSKGYGFVSFVNDVDVQKIVGSQIHFHGKKLKLGPAIRKQKLCARHVQPRPLVVNPPPPPQFQNVWRNPNTETYLQPQITPNPVTQHVQAYSAYPHSPGQVITGCQLLVYNYQEYPTYPDSAFQVTTGYQLPVYNYQPFPAYPRSPFQVTAGYQLPVYNYQPFPAYPSSPFQVTAGYQLPVYNYQAFPAYPNSPVQVTTGYQLPVYNYQAFPAYPSSPFQVTTGYQLPVYNYQAFPAYPNSAVQVTTGYQFHVYNYQMPPQCPVGEQRRNLWTEAYKWWYLVCLIQRRD
ncbi:hypothetical protein G5576_117530 [Homo sapiens]|uniref:Deleted in azoospermia 1 n=1 Tax=Homo sapiens TaxID=9606 RepID=A0A0A0MSR9_HUMAN|nr:hypothetical protein KI723_240056 [Homo sapiens]KAI3998619.1 hypothetical protein G5576_117530 [Homo sapiens]